MKKSLLTAAALAAILAAQSTAQDGMYLKGAIGYGMMDDASVVRPGGEGVIDPEGDARFMVGIGRAFGNNWRIDVDAMDRYADGGAVNDTNGSTDIQNVTVMLNGIYDLNRDGKLNPYLGLGVGASRSNVGLSTSLFGPPINAEADATEFAYQGLAGIGVRLSDRLSADFEYRYVDLGDVDGAGFGFEDMESHDLLIGLRYALSGRAPAPAPAPAPPRAAAAPVAAACENVDFVVYFEWDESGLTSQASQTITAAANQASRCQIVRVSVEGHADRSGAAAYNVGLSDRRARAVRDELVRRGVSASAITIEARGEGDPAVDTPDGVREPLNRRSEVVITVGGPSS